MDEAHGDGDALRQRPPHLWCGVSRSRAEREAAEATPVQTIIPWVEKSPQGRFLCIPGDAGYPVTSVRLDEAKRG